MAGPHCDHTEVGFCPICDAHLFRVGVTIHNDSAIAALKERKELTDKNNAEIKKLNKKIGRLRLVIGMILIFVTLCLVVIVQQSQRYVKVPEPTITIKRPISFNSEESLAPGQAVAGSFFMEEYRRVTINVMAECKDYVEGSLRIDLLDEYNYRMFEIGQPCEVIDTVGANSYHFNNGLERGRYFIIIQNTSDVQEIVIKVNAGLSYEVDNPDYYLYLENAPRATPYPY
jgi:hypothetical protein